MVNNQNIHDYARSLLNGREVHADKIYNKYPWNYINCICYRKTFMQKTEAIDL